MNDVTYTAYVLLHDQCTHHYDYDAANITILALGSTDRVRQAIHKAASTRPHAQPDVIDQGYLTALTNLDSYAREPQSHNYGTLKGVYIRPSTHRKIRALPPDQRYAVYQSFDPTKMWHKSHPDSCVDVIISKLQTSIPQPRLSTLVKEAQEQLPPTTTRSKFHHTNGRITSPPYPYIPSTRTIQLLSTLPNSQAVTLVRIAATIADSATSTDALARLAQACSIRTGPPKEPTPPAPPFTAALTTDKRLKHTIAVAKRINNDPLNTPAQYKCLTCTMPYSQHRTSCLSCKGSTIVPTHTPTLVTYRDDLGGEWQLVHSDHDFAYQYRTPTGQLLSTEDTATLIDSYHVPHTDEAHTPPLPPDTPPELQSASDDPLYATARQQQAAERAYDTPTTYAFHPLLTDIRYTTGSLTPIDEDEQLIITPNPDNKIYNEAITRLAASPHPTLKSVLSHASPPETAPIRLQNNPRRTEDEENKAKRHKYAPATLQQLNDALEHGPTEHQLRFRRFTDHANRDAPAHDIRHPLDNKFETLRDIELINSDTAHYQRLLSRLPRNRYTQQPPRTDGDKLYALESIMRAHKGETRIVHGKWQRYTGPCPTPDDPHYGHLHHTAYMQHADIVEQINQRAGNTQVQYITNHREYINTVLAKDPLDPDHFHYKRAGHAWTISALFTMHGHDHTAEDIYHYYLTLPILTSASQRGAKRGAEERDRERRRCLTTLQDYLRAQGIPLPRTRTQIRIVMQHLGPLIATVHHLTKMPHYLTEAPIQLAHDHPDDLRWRATFDHRLSIPLADLPDNIQILFPPPEHTQPPHKHARHAHTNHRWLTGEMFWRCPNLIQPTPNHPAKPCGKICSSISSWTYHRRANTTNKPRHNWNCKDCNKPWTRRLPGTRFVMLTDGQHALQLILDEPPEEAYNQFIKNRIQFYMRFEPNAPALDAPPIFPPSTKHRRLQLVREASNAVWTALLTDPDITALTQLIASSTHDDTPPHGDSTYQ